MREEVLLKNRESNGKGGAEAGEEFQRKAKQSKNIGKRDFAFGHEKRSVISEVAAKGGDQELRSRKSQP